MVPMSIDETEAVMNFPKLLILNSEIKNEFMYLCTEQLHLMICFKKIGN